MSTTDRDWNTVDVDRVSISLHRLAELSPSASAEIKMGGIAVLFLWVDASREKFIEWRQSRGRPLPEQQETRYKVALEERKREVPEAHRFDGEMNPQDALFKNYRDPRERGLGT